MGLPCLSCLLAAVLRIDQPVYDAQFLIYLWSLEAEGEWGSVLGAWPGAVATLRQEQG